MTHQYQCPKCQYTAGSKGSVKAHITRKTDETHKGLSGPEHGDEINQVDVSDPDESGDISGDRNPAMGGPTADTPDSSGQPEETAGTELPCGCESVDMSDVEPPVIIKCDVCGREYPYE